MLSGELGVSQAFLARWYNGGGYVDVCEVVVFCDCGKIYIEIPTGNKNPEQTPTELDVWIKHLPTAENPEQNGLLHLRSHVSHTVVHGHQWRTHEFCSGGGGSTNLFEDRENGDLGAVAP